MKREVIALLILIIAISPVYAETICSNGADVNSDHEEIKVGMTKSVNGLIVSVSHADEINALRKFTAGLIIDSASVFLSNVNASNSSKTIVLSGEKRYIVTLVNATDSFANIKIDSTSKRIEKEDTETVKNLEVVLINSGLSE